MNRKGLIATFKRWYKPVLGTALALVGIYLLFIWRIGDLPPNFSPLEKAAVLDSSSIKNIVDNPLNIPHKLVQYGVQELFGVSTTSMRLVSAFFGLLATICFFLICKWWFKSTIAWFASALFIFSPWLIINSRSADTAIMFLSSITIIAAYLWLQSSDKQHDFALISLALAAMLSLYIPGVVWITIVGALAVQKPLYSAYKQSAAVVRYVLPIIMTLLITPLAYAVVYDPRLLKQLLLIPDQLLSPVDSLTAIVWSGLGVIWRTRDNLPTTLGTLPVLDALCVVLFIVGCFWLLSEYRRRRTYWLFGTLAVSIVVIGLNRQALLLMLILPAIYIIIAAGLNFLYKEWFTVFPRNPLAKWVGIGVIVIAVTISCIYNVRYSLVAWPRSPETTSYYVIQ